MDIARCTVGLVSLDNDLLSLLSSSEGKLVTDSNEMSRVSALRQRHEDMTRTLIFASERLAVEHRNFQRFRPLAAAASEIHSVLFTLAHGFEEKCEFLVGLTTVQAIVAWSLRSPARNRNAPDRLAQAAYAIRLDLHRIISLGLDQHLRRLFTVNTCTLLHYAGALGKDKVPVCMSAAL